jgi:hypothetical protein
MFMKRQNKSSMTQRSKISEKTAHHNERSGAFIVRSINDSGCTRKGNEF